MKKIIIALSLFATVRCADSQVWQRLPPKPDSANNCFGAFSFSTGSKVYYGGGAKEGMYSYGFPLFDFYEFDVPTQEWSKKRDIPIYNWYATSFSVDGVGYIGPGGAYEYSLTDSIFHQLWQYNAVADSWVRKADYPPSSTGKYPVSFSINHKAYVASDSNFFEYDPTLDTWNKRNNFPGKPSVAPSSFVIDGFGYIVSWGVGSFPELWQYDPSHDRWTKKKSVPIQQSTSGTSLSLQQNWRFRNQQDPLHITDSAFHRTIGCAGFGNNFNQLIGTIFMYDAIRDTWSPLYNPSVSARGGAIAVSSGDSIGYIGDGFDGQGGTGIGNLFNDWWSLILPNVDTVLFSGVRPSGLTATIHCYPQPATSLIQFAGLASDEVYHVKCFDALGREVLSSQISKSNPELELSGLAGGTYTLLLQDQIEIIPIRITKR